MCGFEFSTVQLDRIAIFPDPTVTISVCLSSCETSKNDRFSLFSCSQSVCMDKSMRAEIADLTVQSWKYELIPSAQSNSQHGSGQDP